MAIIRRLLRILRRITGTSSPSNGNPDDEAPEDLPGIIDDAFDLVNTEVHDAIVVFESGHEGERFTAMDLESDYHQCHALPICFAQLTSDQLKDVADWDEVRRIRKNVELEYYNAQARQTTRVDAVQTDLGYTGDGVHAAVIDSGVDGDHPDLQANVAANWQWAGSPGSEESEWVDASGMDTDTVGHGTHVSGTVGGDGSQSDGRLRGMAPDATLSVYSAGATLFITQAVAAYDHLIARKRAGETDVQIVTNSYGSSSSDDFDPDDPLNVATWEAFNAGILPVFSAGNSGPDTDTLNDYAKAPHILSVAATNDEKDVTDFSSRGRKPSADGPTNYNRQTALANLREYHESGSATGPLGLYRCGVGAPGKLINSTMSPLDLLQLRDLDLDFWYAELSGTSMSCPVVSGIAALAINAYQQHNEGTAEPIDVLNTIETEAEDAREGYTPWNVGAGFVDGHATVQRAENGNWGTFDTVELVSGAEATQ
jgi:serine protease AprX